MKKMLVATIAVLMIAGFAGKVFAGISAEGLRWALGQTLIDVREGERDAFFFAAQNAAATTDASKSPVTISVGDMFQAWILDTSDSSLDSYLDNYNVATLQNIRQAFGIAIPVGRPFMASAANLRELIRKNIDMKALEQTIRDNAGDIIEDLGKAQTAGLLSPETKQTLVDGLN